VRREDEFPAPFIGRLRVFAEKRIRQLDIAQGAMPRKTRR
jgi:hypothetical protein